MADRLCWGIVSTGKISSDFVNALQHDGGRVGAVAARSLADAEAFAAKFGVERSYGDYRKLAEDPGVDVVYVGSVNTTHAETVRIMLAAGKPVLCEKPLCTNEEETKQLVDLARTKGTFLMEAVWSRFTPAYTELRRRVEAGAVGRVCHVGASFGQPMRDVERLRSSSLGGGSVLDIGIYTISIIEWVLGAPESITAVGGVNEEGVEHEVCATLRYSGDRFGTFQLSTCSELPNEAWITGTEGTIRVPAPFWSPEGLHGAGGAFASPLDPSDRTYNFENSQALKFEAREVEACVKKGLTESAVMPLDTSLLLARIMAEVRAQVGARPY